MGEQRRGFWSLPPLLKVTLTSSDAFDLAIMPLDNSIDNRDPFAKSLRPRIKNATIVYVGVFAIKYDLIVNHAKHRFENPSMACCGNGGPPHNYNPNITCGRIGFTVCDEESRRVSRDGVHFTEAADSFTASGILSSSRF